MATGSTVATAQSGGKAAASSTAANPPADAARPRYEKGRALEAAGKLDLAYDEYAAAYKLYNHWQIAGTLGAVALKLGKYLEAAERISQFLREATGLDPATRNEMEKQLAQAKAKIGTLTFETAAGSEIFVRGKSVGRAPITTDVFVEPGTYEVEAKKAGATAKRTVDVGAGKREVVKLRYGGADPTPVPTGTATGPDATADPTATVTGSGPAPTVLPPTQDKPFSGRKVLLAAGGTLAATGLVLGGIAVGVSVDYEDKARTAKSKPTDALSTSAATYKTVAVWSAASGAAVLGATLLYYFLSEPQKASVQATGFIGPRGGGVLVEGQF